MTINNNSSKPASLCFGLQRGSVLDPVLFILYMKPLSNEVECHSTSCQSSADNTQFLDPCHPNHLDTTVQDVVCISEVKLWIDCDKKKLNDANKWISSDQVRQNYTPCFGWLFWHSICISRKKPPDHNINLYNHGWPYHIHLQVHLCWTSVHKQDPLPSDSQCNHNIPLCPWCCIIIPSLITEGQT